MYHLSVLIFKGGENYTINWIVLRQYIISINIKYVENSNVKDCITIDRLE